jgi:lysozyme
MTSSANGINLTKAFEQCRLVAYWDGTYLDAAKTIKRQTIGWGTTRYPEGSLVQITDTCVQSDADNWLVLDKAKADGVLSNCFIPCLTNQNQFDSISDFVYNAGIGSFLNSALKRLLIGGLVQQAADELPKWKFSNGEPSNGELRRRYAERALFLGDFKPDGSLKTTKEDFPDAVWIEMKGET